MVPPKDALNILLILTDDAGFAIPSTFGGVIPTPSMERIANEGLRYNRMMSTALCSPTRAALITGRNHHSVGFGVIAEQATGFPGYDSVIGVDNATIGRVLRDNGYATSWFGKHHNTPTYQASQAGPFTQWPTGLGFDYFYGFVGGDANQWQPNLFRNTTQIYPWVGQEGSLKMDRSDPKAEVWPVTGEEPSWNLITAMADDAIDWMTRIHQTNRDQPIFIKYAPGSSHAPHHKDLAVEAPDASGQLCLSFTEVEDDVRLYEYAVLVTSLNDEILTGAALYRDRADCENNFDELKHHWGWGGFTTRDFKRSRLMARMIASVYNWWSLFARLAEPDKHSEAITTRPLLLHAPARQID